MFIIVVLCFLEGYFRFVNWTWNLIFRLLEINLGIYVFFLGRFIFLLKTWFGKKKYVFAFLPLTRVWVRNIFLVLGFLGSFTVSKKNENPTSPQKIIQKHI